jgi:chorismate mutase
VDTLVQLDKPARRIAVNAGGHLEQVARGSFRRAELLPIADNAAVRMALMDRTTDAVVTDNFEEKVWTASAPDAVRLGTLSDDRKAYLLPAGNTELAAELDRWLLARGADGTLAELRRRYIRNPDGSEIRSGDETLETTEPVAALAAAVRERLALMPMVYEAKKAEGKPIEDKVQEAAVLDGAVRAVAAEAAAAGGKSPDPEAVRALFDVLIAVGKDAQQHIADTEARTRPGRIVERKGETPTAVAGANGDAAAGMGEQAGAAADGTKTDAPAGALADAAATPPAKAPPRNTGPDLATEIRPAIARIGEKIARILVAMKEPVSARNARARLEASLTGHGVRLERLDAMAEAVARVSR